MKKSKIFTLAASLLVFGMVACEDTDLRAVSGIETGLIASTSSSSWQALSSSSRDDNLSSSVIASSSSSVIASETLRDSATCCSSQVILSEEKQSSSSAKSSSSVVPEILGTCAPESDSIVMTGYGTWVFTQTSPEDTSAADDLKFKWILDGSYQETASGTGKRSVTAQYPKTGTFVAKLSIAGGDTITCAPLTVTVAPITGCECTVDKETVDVSDGYELVTWKISGCESDLGISNYTWSDDVSPTWTSATLTFKSAGQSVTPTVAVSNDNGSYLEVSCPTVTAISSN